MLRLLTVTAATIALFGAAASPVAAAPCKDAKGRFIKCPPKPAAKPVRCKAANGKFAKCGTPGAHPM